MQMREVKRLSCYRGCGGFTLVELLVALSVSSIVLAAVATLAYAMGTANDSTDDTSVKQAQIRYTTLRLSELIRHSKLICFAGPDPDDPDDFVVWRGDNNPPYGQINASELVIIESGSSRDHLHLYEFVTSEDSDPEVTLSGIGAYSTNWWTIFNMSMADPVPLIRECSNVRLDVLPLKVDVVDRRFVNISFELLENGFSRQYQISAYVRGWGGNLLNEARDGLVERDDD